MKRLSLIFRGEASQGHSIIVKQIFSLNLDKSRTLCIGRQVEKKKEGFSLQVNFYFDEKLVFITSN